MNSQKFSKIKFQNIVYNVGDDLIILDGNRNFLVGRLKEVIPFGGLKEYEEWPCIRVQWYFNQYEVDLQLLGVDEIDKKYL
mmetsp:Transcript_18230/g.20404  ORF Transcript_18230/g.20404 Transcript_18230/m.20404 type:complete len:81 (-) Transcript_18230:341-583(-)